MLVARGYRQMEANAEFRLAVLDATDEWTLIIWWFGFERNFTLCLSNNKLGIFFFCCLLLSATRELIKPTHWIMCYAKFAFLVVFRQWGAIRLDECSVVSLHGSVEWWNITLYQVLDEKSPILVDCKSETCADFHDGAFRDSLHSTILISSLVLTFHFKFLE